MVLGGVGDGKVALVASFSRSAVERGLSAAAVVREAAAVVGGGGGGRDDVAQAGGRNPERLDEALEVARDAIRARARAIGFIRCGYWRSTTGRRARARRSATRPRRSSRPLGVISPPDPGEAARLAADEGAGLIVVGLPVSLDGTEREQAASARAFAGAVGGVWARSRSRPTTSA